jgi:hypothetical protein
MNSSATPTAPPIESLARLAEELHLCWSLLDMAVRLERDWDDRLSPRRDDAFASAIGLGRRIAGDSIQIETLGDLRAFIVERIDDTVELASSTLADVHLDRATLASARNAIDQVRDIGELLAEGVNVRDCRCTVHRGARRKLMGRLIGCPAPDPLLVDSAHQLTRLACVEATQQLRRCIEACAKWSGKAPSALH